MEKTTNVENKKNTTMIEVVAINAVIEKGGKILEEVLKDKSSVFKYAQKDLKEAEWIEIELHPNKKEENTLEIE